MPAALRHWDGLLGLPKAGTASGPDTLALTFFDDERPLCGAAGLADWRLGGRISRLISDGHCSGCAGESLIMPAGRKLPFERILLFGLGPSQELNDGALKTHAGWILEVLRKAKVAHYALQIPGRATGLIGARPAAEIWKAASKGNPCNATLMDSPDAAKTMRDVLAG